MILDYRLILVRIFLCYVHDIILVNLTLYATRKMLQICEKYAVKLHIQFISIKSRTTVFPTNRSSCDKIELNGTTLRNGTKTKHLGHMLNYTCMLRLYLYRL